MRTELNFSRSDKFIVNLSESESGDFTKLEIRETERPEVLYGLEMWFWGRFRPVARAMKLAFDQIDVDDERARQRLIAALAEAAPETDEPPIDPTTGRYAAE